MKKFYLHDGKAQKGPYDINELKQQNISPQTPVWATTLEDWTPAGEVEELKGLFTSTPPPFRKVTAAQASSSPNRKPWIIALSIASFIFLAIIFFANRRGNESGPANADTARVANPKKTPQQEQEERERQRIALQKAQQIIDREYRNNWSKYITYKTSDFEVGFFGGISELEITVNNNTENLIDKVVVQVDYIKESGDLWESKHVVVTNMPPGASKTVKAPESSRGIKIKTMITSITSKSLSFCFDKTKEKQLKKSYPLDPWKCR